MVLVDGYPLMIVDYIDNHEILDLRWYLWDQGSNILLLHIGHTDT